MCVDCVLASPRIAQVDPGDEPFPRWFCHNVTSPILFRNASFVTSHPLCRFSPWFPFYSEADALKIQHRLQAHPLLTPFLVALRPIKGAESVIGPHQRLPSATTHLRLPSNSATLLPLSADSEHHTTSLYLTEVSRLATVAHSDRTLSSGEPHHRKWTPGPWRTVGLANFPG
jgi:hypothetical protein